MKQVGKKSRKWARVAKAYKEKMRNYEGYLVCKTCGSWNGSDVDHIKKRSTHPELVFEESNWQIICRDCHSKKDK